MKELIWLLLLCFLFAGEPNLWTVLHAKAVEYFQTTKDKP